VLSGPSRAGCEGAKASGDSDAGASAKAAWPTGKRGSSMWRELAHSPALVSGFVVWLLMSARVLLLVSEPSDRYIGAVPDDAFYYFQLARNFSRFGRWTFDGVAPSTGFHPLYAYLLAGSGLVGHDADPRRLLLVVGLASSAAIGASAALGASTASRVLGWQSAPWVTAVFVTPLALDQATMLLETWLACLFAAVVVHRIFASRQISRTVIVTVAVAGVLGSLTRTDFVVLTAGIVLGLALTTHAQVDRRRLGAAAVTLGGAVVGLALVAVQNITIAGKPVQASIVVKAYWNQVAAQGTDPWLMRPCPRCARSRRRHSSLCPQVPWAGIGSSTWRCSSHCSPLPPRWERFSGYGGCRRRDSGTPRRSQSRASQFWWASSRCTRSTGPCSVGTRATSSSPPRCCSPVSPAPG